MNSMDENEIFDRDDQQFLKMNELNLILNRENDDYRTIEKIK